MQPEPVWERKDLSLDPPSFCSWKCPGPKTTNKRKYQEPRTQPKAEVRLSVSHFNGPSMGNHLRSLGHSPAVEEGGSAGQMWNTQPSPGRCQMTTPPNSTKIKPKQTDRSHQPDRIQSNCSKLPFCACAFLFVYLHVGLLICLSTNLPVY